MKIKEYEIVDKIEDNDEYEYEEMTFGELLERTGLTEEEKNEAVRARFAVNIHQMVSKENYERCLETIEDRLTDPRLAKLNAIVFLSLKQKKRGVNHEIIDFPLYKKVIDLAMEKGVGFGADSCSAPKLMKAIEDHKDFKTIQNVIEPCEILKFSSYINHKGEYSPCSFLDGVDGWDKPIDMTKVVNFEKEVWFSEKCKAYRQKRIDLENQGIACTYYEV